MASQRHSPISARTSYHIVDEQGNVQGHGSNKSAASRLLNSWKRIPGGIIQDGKHIDVSGWTLRPVPRQEG